MRTEQAKVTPSQQFEAMDGFIRTLQDSICTALEAEDPERFREDQWQRPEGGGGRSRVLAGGATIEKGGVNVSRIHGELSEELAKQLQTERMPFAVCGLSLVIHPRSPRVPTTHMNVRYFETACRFKDNTCRFLPTLSALLGDDLPEVLPIDKLHDDEIEPLGALVDIEHLDNIGMFELGSGSCFSQKALYTQRG